MAERDEWSFQWPDGTWIHWNPRTQAWEKETQSGAAPAPVSAPAPMAAAEVAAPVAEAPAPEQLEAVQTEAVASEPVEEAPEHAAAIAPAPVEADPEPDIDEREEEIAQTRPVQETARSGRSRRHLVDDVLPPRAEPERPGGSWWPTILAGAAIGIAVGLVLWSLIR